MAAGLVTATTDSECADDGTRCLRGAASSCALRAAAPAPKADAQLRALFKPAGPRETDELLSNAHIDAVLQMWAAADATLVPFPFAMIDSTEKTPAHPLAAAVAPCDRGRCFRRLLADGKRAAACVVNTDRTGGRGVHWFALFVDARDRGAWTVEYFNSSGRPAHANVLRWMARARSALAAARAADPAAYGAGPVESLRVTQLQHQRSNTECGVYALYYVRARLDGVPCARFAQETVSDDLMREFRKHVFRRCA